MKESIPTIRDAMRNNGGPFDTAFKADGATLTLQIEWATKLFGNNVPSEAVGTLFAIANSEARLTARLDPCECVSENLEYNLRRIATALRSCGVEGVN